MSIVRFIKARGIAAPPWRVVVVVDGFAVSYCRLKATANLPVTAGR
jgi:hypothetical protein